MAPLKRKHKPTRATAAARLALIVSALLLPSLSLLPLGGLWLWEKGYLLHWAVAATLTVLVFYVLQRWLLSDGKRLDEEAAAGELPEIGGQHPAWSQRERQAWAAVEDIASRIELEKMTDAQAFLDLGHETINSVARAIHGEKQDAVWRFTVPEAMAISERVSAELGSFVQTNIPFGNRLTVAQALQVYRWRSAADVASRAYDIWRIVRLANPATAVTNEARERLTRALVQWGQEQVSRRLVVTFVEAVGRAAIDLYGGRLRLSPKQVDVLTRAQTSASEASMTIDEPVKVVIVASDATRTQALYALFHDMEQRRVAAVTAFVQGRDGNDALMWAPPVDVTAVSPQALTDAAGGRPNVGKDASVIAVLPSSLGAIDPVERDAVAQIVAASAPASPAILPILDHPVSEVAAAHMAEALGSAIAAAGLSPHVAPAIGLSFVEADAEDDQATLWGSLRALAIHTRRNALLRRLEGAKSRASWGETAKQAAGALGQLSKSLIRRKK